MSATERRQREKEALRQEILAAARELFAREGYESVSMRRIAERIEYSPTTIYLHFKDKSELIEEICNQTFALLSRKLQRVFAATRGDPVERLRAGLKAYVQFGLKHPDQYRVTFMMPHPGVCKEQGIPTSQGGQTFQFLMRGVAECIRAGRFRETDEMEVSQSLWTIIHGLTSLQITHARCFPWVEVDRLVDLTIDTALRGLLR